MTRQKDVSVAILLWGTRGGPIRMIGHLMNTASELNLNFHWIVSSNIQGLDEQVSHKVKNLISTKIPGAKWRLFFDLTAKKKAITQTISYLEENKINKVFLLMPHPWDISLARKLSRIKNIEIWRGIHDLEKHPGDIWPTKKAIKKCLEFSNVYVSFSPFIASRLTPLGKPVIRSAIYEPSTTRERTATEGAVLFVGRIRDYKGLELLKMAWPLVTHREKSLTIAGEGRLIPFDQNSSIQIHNRWLSDKEIETFIDASEVVVLPYIEASQSGIISIANARGVPVVVTPVGGLTSQVKNGKNGIISEGLTPVDLANAIDKALIHNWKIVKSDENPLVKFLFDLSKND